MLDKKRPVFHGIEVNEKLTWERWKPGQEYTKYIFLKNVSPDTKYLSYRIPKSSFYITKYPRKITLFYGTSIKIPIIFRPDTLCSYKDELEFLFGNGSFKIPLIGLLPSSDLILPDILTFGMCAVRDNIQQTFEIKNKSDQSFSLRFVTKSPFKILNEECKVQLESAISINIEFNPVEAKHYQEVIECVINENDGINPVSTKSIHVEAIAKYPHLIVKTDGKQNNTTSGLLVDYNDCVCGTIAKRIIHIENPCNFSVPFMVHQENKSTSYPAFSYTLNQKSLSPKEKLKLPIYFKPVVPHHVCCDQLEIQAVGNILAGKISLKGAGIGPDVEMLCPNGVNFNLATIGTKVERSFELKNNSKFPAYFKFQIDNTSSVFQLSPLGGQIDANGTQTIVASFKPSKPIHFYRRVPCIIHDQGPLFVELFGTCHDKLTQPAVLKWKHIENFNKSYQDMDLSVGNGSNIASARNCEFRRYIEDFRKPNKARLITIDRQNIDFGFCQPSQCYQKTFTITNHTDSDICCSWITESHTKRIFSISPSEFDLEPLKSTSFKVSFMPINVGSLAWIEFEGYFFYKQQEDHRTTETDSLLPPWCLTLQASGHTFPSYSEPFLPNVEIDKLDLYFPLEPLTQPSFSTLLMKNCGDTPLLFKFKEDLEYGFSCKPNVGLVKSGFEVVTFCALPSSFGTTRKTISCQLNGSDKFQETIACTATVGDIIVEFVPESDVHFKPTCIGTSSSGWLTIKNVSQLQLSYEWIISSKAKSYVNPIDCKGILLPLETKKLEWIFSPLQEKLYSFDVGLIVKTVNQGDSLSKRYQVKVKGEGKTGKIRVDCEHLNFSNIIVGSLNQKLVRLINESDCDVDVELFCRVNGNDLCNAAFESSNEVEIGEKGSCQVSSLSVTLIKLFIKPQMQRSCQVDIYYKLKFTEGRGTENPTIFLCSAAFNSVYPMIIIDDVRGSGSLEMASKTKLWNQLSLKKLNGLLCDTPSKLELKYKGSTKYSTRFRMPVNTPAENTFDFGSSHQNANGSIFHLNFNNSGATECQWHLLLPSDIKLQLEHWAEEDLFDEDELQQIHIMDNNIFQLEPRHGALSPGQLQTVTITYNHSDVGIHKIPVLFKIDCGREIMLKFIGTTVEIEKPYLHFVNTSHRLTDQVIGHQFYPVQHSTLTNGGAVPVHYSVDVQFIESQQKENYGYTIFECLDPCNAIKAGCCHHLPWKFNPLEEKEYKIVVPMNVVGGDTTMMTIIGSGCKSKELKEQSKVMNADDVPKKQITFLQNQIASLSQEMIDFGYIPLHSIHRLSIFMKNHSDKHPISFKWNNEGSVSVEPDNGIIEPGCSAHLKVLVFDDRYPAIRNLDLACQVFNEDERQLYMQRIIKWNEEEEEKKHHFTITDNTSPLKSKGPLSKFSTLPPISPDQTTRSSSSLLSTVDKPQPSKPLILHLGVSLETCYIKDYSRVFPQTTSNHFFQKHALNSIIEQENKEKIAVTCSEMDIIETVIGRLISDLLYDKSFPTSLESIATEPIPYFCMLGEDTKIADTKDEIVLEEKIDVNKTDNENDASNLKDRQQLKEYEPFRRLTENILEETIWNLMAEASLDEIKLTTRPRMVVLPPTESTKIT